MHKELKEGSNFYDFYKSNNPAGLNDGSYVPIEKISCFNASPRLNVIAFSFNGTLIEIKLDSSARDRLFQPQFSLINSPDKKNITNIKYAVFGPETFLYFSTSETIYYGCSSRFDGQNTDRESYR